MLTTAEAASPLREITVLTGRLIRGEKLLMASLAERDTDAWQRAFACWTALDRRYQAIVLEHPGIEAGQEGFVKLDGANLRDLALEYPL